MSPKPTGHVRGNDLILTRTFRAPIDDVWTSVTKSENTALWFGSWEGDAGPGKIVRLQLVHEKGQPWTNVTIEECEAPRRLKLSAAPTACGIVLATTADDPMRPTSGAAKCMDPALPPETPPLRPYSSANMASSEPPLAM